VAADCGDRGSGGGAIRALGPLLGGLLDPLSARIAGRGSAPADGAVPSARKGGDTGSAAVGLSSFGDP